MDYSKVKALYKGDTKLAALYRGDTKLWPAEAEETASKLYLTLTSELTQTLYFTQSEANGVSIDWGDGSAAETVNATSAQASHTFPAEGDYVVTMTAGRGVTWSPGAGEKSLMGAVNNAFKTDTTPTLTSIVIGGGVPQIRHGAFVRCTELSSVTFTQIVDRFGEVVFNGCTALKEIELPVTDLSGAYSCFSNCSSLEKVWIRDNCISIIDAGDIASLSAMFWHLSKLIIYAEASERPAGWGQDFNAIDSRQIDGETVFEYAPVVWGQKTRPW